MRIWVVNDDGIQAKGIAVLAEHARRFGDVTVIAPEEQCSGMSQRITFSDRAMTRVPDYPVEGVRAYSVKGTPADCVIAAADTLPRADLVLSGINAGWNIGIDILYSGTVGAAMEGLVQRIPAIAFSQAYWPYGFDRDDPSLVAKADQLIDQTIDGILSQLINAKIPANQIWNVNFPGCSPEECRGILYDRVPSQKRYGEPVLRETPNSDREALLAHYISVGTVRNMVLREEDGPSE